MKKLIVLSAVAAALSLSTQAMAQARNTPAPAASSAPAPAKNLGALSCVFDGMTPADRALAFHISSEDSTQVEADRLDTAVNKVATVCAMTNGWTTAQRNSAVTYAVQQANFNGATTLLTAQNYPTDKLRARWNALSPEDKAKFLADPVPDAFISSMSLIMRLDGVPEKSLELAFIALSSLSTMAAAERAW